MIPIEQQAPPWPALFHRRVTSAKAMKVTADNLTQAAKWTGGHTWASSVVVPIRMSNGRTGEMTAGAGDWIVEIAPDTFQVWPADRFHAEWEAAR